MREQGTGSRKQGAGNRETNTAPCPLPPASLFFIPYLFLLLSSSLFPLPSTAADVWPQMETRHFLVVAEPTSLPDPVSLTDWDAILRQYIEQLDAKYVPLFGGKTLAQSQVTLGQKPILFICADKASYLKRLGEYGVANPATAVGSGGYYHPDANIIFTWRQPTDYYARHVVLHEVAHWYCLQLLSERYTKLPLWLCEGLADHAAFHTWDGKTLQAMRLPRVSLENYPFRLQAIGFGLQKDASITNHEVQFGRITPDSVLRLFERLRAEPHTDPSDVTYDEYSLAWGLVAFLLDEFPSEMTRFFELIKRNDVSECWRLVFEDDENQPTWSQLADWTDGYQLPWQWGWNHWEDTGTELLGISDSTALIVQNPAYKPRQNTNTSTDSDAVLFRCEVAPLLERTIIGLVFRYENSERFEMLQFCNVGSNITEWRHVRFAQNQWEMLSAWRKASDFKPQSLHATLEVRSVPSTEGHVLQFSYNGNTVTELPCNDDGSDTNADLPFGLAVQSGAAQFRFEIFSENPND